MPRPPRIQLPGGLYHLTGRGNRRQPIFLHRDDYRLFLVLAGKVITERSWVCLSYCLMPNHFHFVLETPKADLSAGMQQLNGTYGRWFNDAHDLTGHVFQGRFKSILIESTAHLLQLARYVALNPVEAGLCARAVDWEWSSYGAALGAVRTPSFLALDRFLSDFGVDRPSARKMLQAFIEDGRRAGT